MFEQVQRQQWQPVAAVGTHAAAELLATTLRVHGMEATTAPVSVYPSLDWVEGVAIGVADLDADRARELLREFGHEPLPERPGER